LRKGKQTPRRKNRRINALSHLKRRKTGLFAIAIFSSVGFAFSHTARAESLLDAGAVDYEIMSPDGHVTLGHGRYTIERQKDTIVLHGESRYTTGEYDNEIDVLSPGLPGGLPTLEKFDHLFYSAEGVLTRASHADLTTALASCTDTTAHIEQSQTLDFPSDTWAGASVLIPIQEFLQGGGEGKLNMNVFNCTSKPGIYPVTVTVASNPTSLPSAQGGAVEVEVKPHFGWFDVFIAPFVPKLNAWFDPGKGWGFEGVSIARYYKGPQILIVESDEKKRGPTQVLVPTPVATPARPHS
jgi:hypothetical protein